MKFTNVSISAQRTSSDCRAMINEIENDPANVVGGITAWNSGYETDLLKGAQSKIDALERRAERLWAKEHPDLVEGDEVEDTVEEPIYESSEVTTMFTSNVTSEEVMTAEQMIKEEQQMSVFEAEEAALVEEKAAQTAQALADEKAALAEEKAALVLAREKLAADEEAFLKETIQSNLEHIEERAQELVTEMEECRSQAHMGAYNGGRTFAYVRVSTQEQTTDNQVLAIERSGYTIEPSRVVSEQVSGSVCAMQREQFASLVEHKLEKGDTLVVLKLDRLGRDSIDVQSTVNMLSDKGVRVVCLDLPIADIASAEGKMMVQMFAAFAEFERNRIRERTQQGLERAKNDGKKLGRPVATDTIKTVQGHKADGLSQTATAKMMGVSVMTVKRNWHKAVDAQGCVIDTKKEV